MITHFSSGYSKTEEIEPKPDLELPSLKTDTQPTPMNWNPTLISLLKKDLSDEENLASQDAESIIGIYKSQYRTDSSDQFFRILMHSPNNKQAKAIFDTIWKWETETGHPTSKEAHDCILKNLENDIVLKKWILDMLDFGFFSKLKQKR